LGLRPENGKEPGTWRAPQVLLDAGLPAALESVEILRLDRPTYHFEGEPGTRLRNGNTIRAFSLELAGKVRDVISANRFPVVIGGDCSVLLGGLYGARLAGGRGLIHVDGHSDFTQAKSYATPQTLGAAAGMDLALATGRGEKVLTDWPVIGVLTADADAIQVGERGEDEDWFPEDYGDILKTEITRLTVQKVQAEGIEASARRVIARLEERGLERAWLHVDLDVLDEAVMPAVDSPGKPGFSFDELSRFIAALSASGRITGADFAIYDPERDPGLKYAGPLVACIAAGIRRPSPRKA
jgi:arginase